jgi:hypothetical protein
VAPSWCYEREVPSNGTDEIEIDDDTPCYSLCLEGCGGVEELELCDMSKRGKGGKKGYARMCAQSERDGRAQQGR